MLRANAPEMEVGHTVVGVGLDRALDLAASRVGPALSAATGSRTDGPEAASSITTSDVKSLPRPPCPAAGTTSA
jgi:hypothetical protein